MKARRERVAMNTIYLVLAAALAALLFVCFFGELFYMKPCLGPDEEEVPSVINTDPDEVTSDGTKIYRFPGDVILQYGDSFGFHTRHHNVKIYADDELIYAATARRTILGTTTGSRWNIVDLPDDVKTVQVRIMPLYDNVRDDAPYFLAGSGASIVTNLVYESMANCFAAIFDCMLGLFLIFYFAIMRIRTKTTVANPLFYVGFDSIIVGIWSYFETDASEVLVHNHVVASAVSFIMLMILSYPYVVYVKESMFKEDRYLYRILTAYYFFNIAFCLAASFTGLADFKETLTFTHIAILSAILYMVIAIINEFVRGRRGPKAYLNLVGFGVVGGVGIADILIYRSDGQNRSDLISMWGFTAYLVIAAYISMSDLTAAIEEGQKAEYYKRLALTDALTGIGSRKAYIEDAEELTGKEPYAVISMDLNGLKGVNDGYGHQEGDRYICAAADMISSVFERYGRCYRTGGDEFAVILRGSDAYKGQELLKALDDRTASYDANPAKTTQGHLTIAAGMAAYTPPGDTSFDDVMRRADSAMYERKREMKAER